MASASGTSTRPTPRTSAASSPMAPPPPRG
uniref:Uncharacterized protein n=1 Tax=Arundo donax TaxID=35708 RepID=A0A0A9FKA9_ARUDO